MKTRILKLAPLFFLSCTACTLFFGTIRPLEVKSSDYQVLDLSKKVPNWVRLGPGGKPGSTGRGIEGSDNENGVSDQAFQEETSNSVISVNSTCKNYQAGTVRRDLSALTQELLLGMNEKEIQEAKPSTIAQTPAWETTARGAMGGHKVVLKTIVLEKGNCVYDLVYVAKPEFFAKDEPAFSRFASSFQFKEN